MDQKKGCLLFDWGNTLMKDFPEYSGPMYLWPNVEVVANADRALKILHENWFIALATNAKDSTKEEIEKSFSRVNLSEYLDEIYCYKSVGFSKPSEQFFEYILNNLNFQKSQVFMIGDDFKNDIEGANRVGIKGIWLNSESTEKVKTKNCKTVHDLLDLPECLDSI